MQIPILNGIYADSQNDFRSSYPVNLVPVPKQQGISAGYLRTADGLTQIGSGPGIDRGGINWEGACYRVMGSKLVTVQSDGAVSVLGDVGSGGRVSLDYSFDRLAIASGGRLYYLRAGILTQVTDPDLGTALDVIWVDGYFMTTDGTSLVVTEINDPTAVNPLKYGSSESDPDPIVGLIKYRNEVYALNRYTIEVFNNVGGQFFPFQRVDGALITKGLVGKNAKCQVAETFAFMGGGRNEQCSIYLAGSGIANKIATREVETLISKYTETQLSSCVLESKTDRLHQHLYVHLPNETIVYDIAASAAMQEPVWFYMSTAVNGITSYRAQNFVFCYNKWIIGDKIDSRIGVIDRDVITQYGGIVGWRFDTTLLYNASKGGIIHELELASLTGRALVGQDPTMFLSWTDDGLTWSDEKTIHTGKIGEYMKRLIWRRIGHFWSRRGLRFRGANGTPITFARLEATLESLNG